MQRIRNCLWFDTNAEEAVKFYTKIFKKSKIGTISRYGENAQLPAGTVLCIQFFLEGQEFLALNGGPVFKFNEAISLMVDARDQKELDYYWKALLKGGGSESQCGWLKDKYGLSWQVVPAALSRMLSDKSPARSARVMDAVMKMVKLDIKKMQQAYDGPAPKKAEAKAKAKPKRR